MGSNFSIAVGVVGERSRIKTRGKQINDNWETTPNGVELFILESLIFEPTAWKTDLFYNPQFLFVSDLMIYFPEPGTDSKNNFSWYSAFPESG